MSFELNKEFKNIDYSSVNELAGEYEPCTFTNCNFANANLSNILFMDCTFNGCDLSLAKIADTSFQKVSFVNCKLIGLHFDGCNQFAIELAFTTCMLNYSSFYQMKLKGIRYERCEMREVEFIETDLTKAVFDKCDLTKAVFERTNLDNTDFRTAENYSIHPEANKLKKTRFSEFGLRGLLDRYNILID